MKTSKKIFSAMIALLLLASMLASCTPMSVLGLPFLFPLLDAEETTVVEGTTVPAELHALMYDYVYGHNGVYNYGQKLAYEIVSNNEIRIKDGLLLNQGRFMRIPTGSYEAITIANGTSGVNRCDLIVAHFETDGINEIHNIRVIKGTSATEPTPTQGNTFSGARVNEMPLYAVNITGLTITSVVQKFSFIKSFKDHTHTKSQVTDFPASLKNPTALKVQLNGGSTEGTNQFTYDGSAAKTLNVTPSLIGLGNVPNVATNNQTPSYTDTSTFATLVSGETISTALSKIKLAITNLINHIANVNNPHSTTKTQVGLSNVPNVATNDQTPTYTDVTTLTTLASGEKLSVAFPKIKLAITNLLSHIANVSNPHATTKSHVGLSNVPNVTTNDQVPTYTDITTLATLASGEKLSVALPKIKLAITNLISHLANVSNPHSVTKAQVGLGSVENKSSATIRGEITAANVVSALTYIPVKQLTTSNINANTLVETGVYIVTGTSQTNTPLVGSWTIRVEASSSTYVTQWATLNTGAETYKRACVNGTWNAWKLVEGERLLWTGSASDNTTTITLSMSVDSFGSLICIMGTSLLIGEVSSLSDYITASCSYYEANTVPYTRMVFFSKQTDKKQLKIDTKGMTFDMINNGLTVTPITKIIGRP